MIAEMCIAIEVSDWTFVGFVVLTHNSSKEGKLQSLVYGCLVFRAII